MPIFMDLHIVPGITARGVAEAHLQDLLIQEEFGCKCMTYWVDEIKESAFCLIEAPNEEAVRVLHNTAHGLLPHQIIEVNKTIVESFLGRIYDPETPEIPEGQLKVFNDTAFRVLVLIDIIDPVLMTRKAETSIVEGLLSKYLASIKQGSKDFNGEIAEHKENISSIVSFTSASNAITFALSLQASFTVEEKELLGLRISINGGMPVTQSTRIFGDTIDSGKNMLLLATPYQIIAASSLGDHANHLSNHKTNISVLTSSNEKLLHQMIGVLEAKISDENFDIDDFGKLMSFSKSSLNRTTQALLKRSPNALLKEYRLNKSLKLLRKNDNISEVAFTVGFNSPSYFSKCFKTHFGISPSELTNR